MSGKPQTVALILSTFKLSFNSKEMPLWFLVLERYLITNFSRNTLSSRAMYVLTENPFETEIQIVIAFPNINT